MLLFNDFRWRPRCPSILFGSPRRNCNKTGVRSSCRSQRNSQTCRILNDTQLNFSRTDRNCRLWHLFPNIVYTKSNHRFRMETIACSKRYGAEKLRIGRALHWVEKIFFFLNVEMCECVCVFKWSEFLLTSMTSVRLYFIQPFLFCATTWMTTMGFGARPWPSHNRLSQEIADSQIGISPMSNRERKFFGFFFTLNEIFGFLFVRKVLRYKNKKW